MKNRNIEIKKRSLEPPCTLLCKTTRWKKDNAKGYSGNSNS